jgi:peptidoglycan/LPS O-acetylase OafA/YrhL
MPDGRPTSPFGTSLSYAPALDGVRALAVGLVLYQHWVDHPWLDRHLPVSTGLVGVKLFFVLSGLLITRILLVTRFEEQSTLAGGLRRFYIRRALRIFPLYYAVLLVLALTSAPFRDLWPWYVTYLQNIRMVQAGHFLFASHLWTLAIEEQFYLVWPLLLFTLPVRRIGPVLLAMLPLAVVWRVVGCWLLRWNDLQISLFTLSSLDSLGLGGLLAWLLFQGRPLTHRALAVVGAAGVAIVVASACSGHLFGVVFADTGVSLAAFALVGAAAQGGPAWLIVSLAAWPLVALGRISYGVYVYHFFVSSQMGALGRRLADLGGRPLLVAGELAVTLLLATLSWKRLEKPINDLKNRWAPRGPVRGMNAPDEPGPSQGRSR